MTFWCVFGVSLVYVQLLYQAYPLLLLGELGSIKFVKKKFHSLSNL